MPKIFYSMSGEGRGHATRVRAMVEALRAEFHPAPELTLFAPHDAWRLLAPLYRGTPVRVVRIPGLRFHYTPRRRLDFLRTAREAIRYLSVSNRLIESLRRRIERERASLVITDFEPALPRAARRAGIPFLSLNHQHFLVVSDLSALPAALRRRAAYMSWVVRSYYRGQAATVVSSFYFPPLKPAWREAVQVGALLRPEILAAPVESRGHLCVYLRKFAPGSLLEALCRSGRRARVYGLGEQPSRGALEFRPVSESGFLEDLASCDALVTTAGNQLVGEALYLRKPVFAMPESGNHEQYINAWFLRQMGAGDWAPLESVRADALGRFLERLDDFRARIRPERQNGNPAALRVIRRLLDGGRAGAGEYSE